MENYQIPVGGEIFRPRPDRPWNPSASYTMCTGSFPGVKRPGRGVDHLPSSAEFKERVELYLYFPSGPSCPVLGWSLPVPYTPSGTALQPKGTATPSSKIWGKVRGKDLKSLNQKDRHRADIWTQNFLVSRTSLLLRVTLCHCTSILSKQVTFTAFMFQVLKGLDLTLHIFLFPAVPSTTKTQPADY